MPRPVKWHVIRKARDFFKKESITYTGVGLTRQELRLLENLGMVRKAVSSAPGPNRYAWGPTPALWEDAHGDANSVPVNQ